MAGPIWTTWFFAGLMVFSAVFHAGRLADARLRGRTKGYDGDLTHLVMSSAMAVLLATNIGAHTALTWSVIIGVPTLWLVCRALWTLTSGHSAQTSRSPRALTQSVQQMPMYAAMLFMLLVTGGSASTASSAAMGGMSMGDPVSQGVGRSTPPVALTSLMLVGLLGLVAARHVWQLRGAITAHHVSPMLSRPDLRQAAAGAVLAPGLGLLCQLAMGGTMIYMLVPMV